jgi:hypothetical protein
VSLALPYVRATKSVLLLVLIRAFKIKDFNEQDFNETKILAGKGHWLVVLLRKTTSL